MLTRYPVNHDVAWLLHVAGRWLEGVRLYVDVVEVNPPLIIMLLTPIAGAADLLGVWDASVFYFAVLCLAAASLWLTARILLRGMAPGTASFVLTVLAALHLFLPRAEFGQREHLMLLLTMPYYFSVVARGTEQPLSRNEGLLTGTLAGLGFAIKPHFLLVLAACELYLGFSRKAWPFRRPEMLAIVAVGITYAIALLVITPSYFEVARWATPVYDAFYRSSWRLIASRPGIIIAATAIIGAFATRRQRGAYLRNVFAIAAAAFAAIVFIQNKNFDYHLLPVYAASAVVWTSLAMEVVRRSVAHIELTAPGHTVLRRLMLAVTAAALITAGEVAARPASALSWSRLGGYADIMSLIEEEGARSWFALSANMLTAFPLVSYADVEWRAPFHSLWPLVGLYDNGAHSTSDFPYRARHDMGATERYVFDATLEALFRARPALILVDRNAPGGRLTGIDFLTYFGTDARFIEFMQDYSVVADLGGARIFGRVGDRSEF
jgi:hypothetical protein